MNIQNSLKKIIDFADTSVKYEVCDNKDHEDKKILIVYFINNTKYLSVDEFTLYIIDKINCHKTFTEIFTELKKKYQFKENIFDLFESFKSTIVFSYLFENNKELNELKKDKYIYPKINLINSKYVSNISSCFTIFFKLKIFWIAFISLPLILISGYVVTEVGFQELYKFITFQNTFIFYFGYILCVFIHEIGHASATLNFGAKPNQIGFGFYLISPVFYCDVSDIWRLQRKERLIVDLGGIYFQWIISFILLIFYYLTKFEGFIVFSFFNFISSLINLNPFLLYDGYWALSDIIGISNLRSKSFFELRLFFKNLIKLQFSVSSLKQTLLIIYAFLSFGMLFTFLYYMIFLNTDSILYFFINCFNFLKIIYLNFNSISFEYIKGTLTSFIAPTIFYWLISKLIYKKIKKWKTR